MGIYWKATQLHWNYFLALEADVCKLSRYIELQKDNYETYSIELVRILFAACSEIEVVMKLLCEAQTGESFDESNIDSWKKTIGVSNPIIQETIYIPRFELKFQPWIDWQKNENPNWWTSHNNVKHNRSAAFKEANLQNVLNAVAALLSVIFRYYCSNTLQEELKKKLKKEVKVLDILKNMSPASSLFRFEESYYTKHSKC